MRGCSEEARGCAHRAGRCAQALVHGFYLYLVNQVEGSFGWMGQQHPIRPAPSKGAFQWEAPRFFPPSGSRSGTPRAGAAATSQLHEGFPCDAVSQEMLSSLIPPPGGIRRWLPHQGKSEVWGGTIPLEHEPSV